MHCYTIYSTCTFILTYDDDYYTLLSDSNNVLSQIVYHEAGHAVISEILCPESVTLVSAYSRGGANGGFTNYYNLHIFNTIHGKGGANGGFTNYYNDKTHTPLYWSKTRIIGALGGMAAIEQKYGIFDAGGERDLDQAFDQTRDLVVNNCISGLHLHCNGFEDSERLKSEQEQAVSAEVEKLYRKAKEIIALNHEFFEKVALALAQKRLISAVDIQKIKSECEIVPVAL